MTDMTTTDRPNQCLNCGDKNFRQNDQWATDGRPGAHPVKVLEDGAVVHACCAYTVEHSRTSFAEKGLLDLTINAYRWSTNNHLIPEEVLVHVGLDADAVAHQAECVRTENRAFVAKMRQAPPVVHSAEALAEMRNAFGEGAEVVNVITGQRTQL